MERILEFLEHVGGAISVVGVLVIMGGFALAAVQYAAAYRRLGAEADFQRFKVGLGHALMLGLEILVLADVIETITVTPTFRSLTVLGSLVVIRTIVSWTLTVEIEGRWPWQTAEAE